jgi:hypothetical protein
VKKFFRGAFPLVAVVLLTPWGASAEFRCSPDTLRTGGSVTIEMGANHPGELAAVSPGGGWYYFQGSSRAVLMPAEAFKKATQIEIPHDIQGIVYKDGKPMKKALFSAAGRYEIVLAENLETEPENTLWLHCFVRYEPAKPKSK